MKIQINNTMEYESKLGLLDLTSLMGYLFGRNHITDWKILEYMADEITKERNEEQYNIEKNYILGEIK